MILVRKVVPDFDDADIEENEKELILSIKNENMPMISKILEDLERTSSLMNIRSFCIKSTSAQECYVTLECRRMSHSPIELGMSFDLQPTNRKKLLNEWRAMLYKKLLIYKYNIVNIACQYIMILFSVFLLFLTSNTVNEPCVSIPLDIGEKYKEVMITFEVYDNINMHLKYKEYFMERYPKAGLIKIQSDTNTNDYMLSRYDYGTAYNYYSTYLAGITYMKDVATIWFNNYFYHSIAISQNIALDVIGRIYLGPNHRIKVINNPMRSSHMPSLRKIEMDAKIFNAYLITWFSMILGIFIISPVKERCSGFVHQQYIHGVRPWVFWLSHFCIDFLIYVSVVALYIGIAYGLDVSGLDNAHAITRILLLLSMFGAASLSFLYLISKGFDTPTSGMGIVYLIYLTFGFMISIFLHELLTVAGRELGFVFKILDTIFMLIPSYALYGALDNIHKINVKSGQCIQFCLRLQSINNRHCHNRLLGHPIVCKAGHKECCYGE